MLCQKVNRHTSKFYFELFPVKYNLQCSIKMSRTGKWNWAQSNVLKELLTVNYLNNLLKNPRTSNAI